MSNEFSDCVLHQYENDDECEFCKDEGLRKQTALQNLTGINESMLRELMRNGLNSDNMPPIFLDMRMHLLMEAVFGNNGRARINFEIRFQQEVQQLLGRIKSDMVRSKLHVPTVNLNDYRKTKQ